MINIIKQSFKKYGNWKLTYVWTSDLMVDLDTRISSSDPLPVFVSVPSVSHSLKLPLSSAGLRPVKITLFQRKPCAAMLTVKNTDIFRNSGPYLGLLILTLSSQEETNKIIFSAAGEPCVRKIGIFGVECVLWLHLSIPPANRYLPTFLYWAILVIISSPT